MGSADPKIHITPKPHIENPIEKIIDFLLPPLIFIDIGGNIESIGKL